MPASRDGHGPFAAALGHLVSAHRTDAFVPTCSRASTAPRWHRSYAVDEMMANPVFGYDMALSQQLGLYRRLSLLTMHAARRRGLRIHDSSSAPGFKASRGGVATVEYHVVELRSVHGVQLAAWQATLHIAARIGPYALARAT